MIGTYAAVLAVLGASLALGQGAIALCGGRRWSWLAPAVGLALLCALCWGTVRLPGGGTTAALAVAVAVLAAVAFLRGQVDGAGALRSGLPVAAGALLAGSLPFLVEGHFGILGTGFNPDMSQHLLATDRLADGETSQLLRQGYPLGPHAVVVALEAGLGVGLVQGFSGLTVAVAVLASLSALAVFADRPAAARTAAALVVGLAYMVASYLAQGAFKETMQALFLLAFVLALRESGRGGQGGAARRGEDLRLVPAALIAVGGIYAYSFASLVWLAPALLLWLAFERRAPWRPLALATLVFAVLVAPEIGRMVEFQRFETFDPDGPGLGNLFGQVSPFAALGIWPSGDFRVAPGDGAVPAVAFYLGSAFALVLLVAGALACWRRHERAVLAGLGAAALAYLTARLGGTPYTAAKAIEVAAPLAALTILLPLTGACRVSHPGGEKLDTRATAGILAALFLLAAGGSSLLALANAPVGPTSYSPALTALRPLLAADSTLVLAPDRLLEEEQGERYVVWELRGGRVCVLAASRAGEAPPRGVRFVVTEGGEEAPSYPGLGLRREAPPYRLWEVQGPVAASSPCPLIAVRQARRGPGG